jgi:hypothetical protein
VFGGMGMLSDGGFRKTIVKGINDMFFEMSLDRPNDLANVGLPT